MRSPLYMFILPLTVELVTGHGSTTTPPVHVRNVRPGIVTFLGALYVLLTLMPFLSAAAVVNSYPLPGGPTATNPTFPLHATIQKERWCWVG